MVIVSTASLFFKPSSAISSLFSPNRQVDVCDLLLIFHCTLDRLSCKVKSAPTPDILSSVL